MTKELRKIRDSVNDYVVLIAEHPEKNKANYKDYLLDFKNLYDLIVSYTEKTSNLLQIWRNESVRVFDLDTSNIFLCLRRYISMYIVNYYLNKFSYELYVCGILRQNLDKMSKRLKQYEIFG